VDGCRFAGLPGLPIRRRHCGMIVGVVFGCLLQGGSDARKDD
jgi:hypothetical protein